ncbi:hypothetical protein D3C78_1922020 [compost metagenome]
MFGQQAAKRGGNQVGDGAEQIAEHQQDGNDRQRPQQIAKPLQPGGDMAHHAWDPIP